MKDSGFWASLSIGAIVTMSVAFAFGLNQNEAQAATNKTFPLCEPINSAATIIVYRCEPDNGAPYLLNSVGFMLQVE